MFSGIFYGFNIGCPNGADVSYKLSEIFDSTEPGNSTSIDLYADPLTKSCGMFANSLKFDFYYYQEIVN